MTALSMMHGDSDMMGGDMMSGMMGGMMLLWALLALALFVLSVVATVWLVKHVNSGARDRRVDAVLEERYAAGEITRDEFLQRRADLAHR